MSFLRVAGFAFLAVTLAPGTSLAQHHVPAQRLSEPAATFPEPFSSIAGLRELSDGRLLVSDRLESAIKLIDFDAGTQHEIGRVGQGPGEFRTPGGLLPLPADSTLLVDFGNMRMTAIAPDGTLAMESMPMMRPDGLFLRPEATDAAGHIYFDMQGMVVTNRSGGRPETPDSAAIARWVREGGEIDTVGKVTNPMRTGSGLKFGGGKVSFSGGASPFSSVDGWGVAPDGRVAIVRSADYRVEWWRPAGSVAVGPVVEYEPVPLTQDDKEAWAERLAGSRVSIVQRSGTQSGGSGGSFELPRPDIDEMEWPEVKPAFPRGAVSVTPEGEVWVERHVPHGDPETYDVFDSAGRRLRQVVLPEGRTLEGFGRGVAYLVRTDADDLQWLERYRR